MSRWGVVTLQVAGGIVLDKSRLPLCGSWLVLCAYTLMWVPQALALTDGKRIRLASTGHTEHAAAVVLEAKGKSCSAVRIAPEMFLMAGHCLKSLSLSPGHSVRLLATNGSRFGHLRVRASFLHPLYATPASDPRRESIERYLNTTVDLGLVDLEVKRVEDPARPFIEAALDIATPDYNEAELGTRVVVVGGGCEAVNSNSARCEGQGSSRQGYLKAATRQLVRPRLGDLELPMGQYYYATNSTVRKSLGPGDSGGPLLLPDGRLLGVHALITAVKTDEETSLPNYHVKLSHPAVATWLKGHLPKPLLLSRR
ncbi:MAG: trypsin-like serine protease [Bdellovibrionales bacterium]|nr:trypsin-like serine protease [Bdellovibrionales bacterium]